MKPWRMLDEGTYRKRPLRAHSLLHDVPVHDAWELDLPGGGPGRTVADVRAVAKRREPGPVVRGLFALRWGMGRLFGWDRTEDAQRDLFRTRLTDEDRARSEVEPGTADGPFTVVYVFDEEAVLEVRNATVHAALVWTVEPTNTGYRLWWGIHVKPVGKLTGMYMRMIGPFRRWIVYPSLFRGLHESWAAAYPAAGNP